MLHRILWHYSAARRSSRLDGEGLKRLQHKKIRALMRHVFNNVPLYHDWFRARKLLPDDVQTSEQLRLLPVLTRQTIESHDRSEMLAAGTNLGRTVSRRTTGTTGRPLDVAWDRAFCDTIMGLRFRNEWFTGTDSMARTLEIQYWGMESPGTSRRSRTGRLRKALFGPVTGPKFPTLRAKVTGFRRKVVEVKDTIMAFRPELVESRPSYLQRLGFRMQDDLRTLDIKKAVLDGEYVSRQAKKDIGELYQAETFDYYGTMELGPLAIECRAHSGKHLNADYFLFEFLKDGGPVGPGEPGDVLVTSLESMAMPLLRYKVGDVIVPDTDEACECGTRLPRVREVLGRPNDGLRLPGGTQLPAGPIVDFLEGVAGLREYQLVQTGMDSVLLKLKEGQDLPRLRALTSDYLKTLFGEEVKLSVETWGEDDIPPKSRPVLSRLTQDQVSP